MEQKFSLHVKKPWSLQIIWNRTAIGVMLFRQFIKPCSIMTQFNFTLEYKSDKGHIFAIDPKALYGYWERTNGEEGGGLWFERSECGTLELVDYDGTSCLPQSIVDKLRENGYEVDESFDV